MVKKTGYNSKLSSAAYTYKIKDNEQLASQSDDLLVEFFGERDLSDDTDQILEQVARDRQS